MPESELHKTLKEQGKRWMSQELGCKPVLEEPTLAKWFGLPIRPDLLGVVMNQSPYRLAKVVEVEVEPDLKGVMSEYRKEHRKSPFNNIADYEWLLHPDTFEPDVETCRIPTHVGLATVSHEGHVKVYRDATYVNANKKDFAIALLASVINNYEASTGRSSQSVRSSHRNAPKLTDGQYAALVKFVGQYIDTVAPDVTLTACAKHLSLPRKQLLKCAKAGIPGFDYDPNAQTLVITGSGREVA